MAAVRVQSLAGSGIASIPAEFIRPLHVRPGANIECPSVKVPLIDMVDLCQMGNAGDKTIEEIGRAASEWGLFQVVNHGISQQLIQRLQSVGKDFFDLPLEEKEKYSNNAAVGILEGYGTKLAHNIDGKEVSDEYAKALMDMVNKLLSALSLHLGVEEHTMKEELGGDDLEMEMKINYYPPCPQPELALGVEPHTDMSSLTLLVPNEVPGLQVYKDGHWVGVDYVPNAIIVHIGDQVEVLSNGKYKSVLHRSVVSKNRVRMSWPVFCTPPGNKVIGPLKELTDEKNPPLYNAKTYAEFKHRKINKLKQ